MKRREFLKNVIMSSAAVTCMTSLAPLAFRINPAHAATGKTVIKIFQRGGCDGLNVVVPHGEDAYYRLRPTIAIARPSATDPFSALDLDGFFGFHPSMTGMRNLFEDGLMAVLPATHYPDASRSHFDSQFYVESAVKESTSNGWMNRHMTSFPQAGLIRAVSADKQLAQALRGEANATALRSFNDIQIDLSGEEEQQLMSRLGEVFQQPTSGIRNHQRIHQAGSQMVNEIGALTQMRDTEYVPANGVIYPNTGLGQRLKMLAQMIKSGIGLEMATVNIGGWDTHNEQGGGESDGRQARRLTELSDAVFAFYQDLGNQMNSDVTTIIGTEFGRTSKENGNAGTDHGEAAAWFVIGGSVRGGIYGNWPGLADDQLHRGRYLASSINHRDIYGDVIKDFCLNNNVTDVLKSHNYSPIGLFS